MKSHPSILVFADDLTGAAEIAAAGFARGLDAVVATGPARDKAHGTLVVHDSDTRLVSPSEAARKIVAIGARCAVAKAVQQGSLLFKKTDSVLRGPVVAELDALSAISRHARVLLVPANPRLGRVIRDGQYLVGGQPIHETAFGRDPHHPARTSSVLDLLGPPRRGEITMLRPGDDLPDSGLAVGEVASLDDIAQWARRIDAHTLPAGSSVFFEAILEARGHAVRERPAAAPDPFGVLVVSGTTAGTTRDALVSGAADGVPAFTMPEPCAHAPRPEAEAAANRWIAAILGSLAQRGSAIALAPEIHLADAAAPGRIRAAFAQMIGELHRLQAFHHLVIEGGATAAMTMHSLKWNVLEVVGELSPGVATLQPRNDRKFRVTLKPGSYPWPKSWWDVLAQARPPSS